MSRMTTWAAVGLAAVVLVSTGCSSQPRAVVGTVDVFIATSPNEKPVHKAVEVTGYPTVLEVTSQVAGVTVETTDNGEEWPVSIGGARNNIGAGQIWRYELNNGFPGTAPNLKHVGPGDVIVWRLQ
ncbi:MAG TPA: hypothetical protein VMY39_04920 [Planctomycetota bacterium]|nr:hypothetical protein [Planctomycetota bacterium]